MHRGGESSGGGARRRRHPHGGEEGRTSGPVSHIVRTCRPITDDVEPSSLPSIPKGTYGIAGEDNGDDYQPVNFGPPWGVQLVGNHDLLDVAAVLLNAKRAITVQRRPWRTVLRRTLRTFAGPYLRLAAAEKGRMPASEEFVVELCQLRSRRAALRLLSRATVISGASAEAAGAFDAFELVSEGST